MWKKLKPFVWLVVLTLLVGGLSAFLTRNQQEVFDTLNQPKLMPPPIAFPIVWSILYMLMGVGLALVLRQKPVQMGRVLALYCVQLAVNFVWPLLFFLLQNYLFAFMWLVLLFVLIVVLIVEFGRYSMLAALLQVPYLFWVGFAGYLNFMIARLN